MALSCQRQWAEYEQRLRDRDYLLAQTQLKLDEVDNAIAFLSVVRTPYSGRMRQIEWLGKVLMGVSALSLLGWSVPVAASPYVLSRVTTFTDVE